MFRNQALPLGAIQTTTTMTGISQKEVIQKLYFFRYNHSDVAGNSKGLEMKMYYLENRVTSESNLAKRKDLDAHLHTQAEMATQIFSGKTAGGLIAGNLIDSDGFHRNSL